MLFSYKEILQTVQKFASLKYVISGASGGLVLATVFVVYGFGFWIGMKQAVEGKNIDDKNQLDSVIIFFNFLLGTFQLYQVPPFVEALTTAHALSNCICEVLLRNSKIDSLCEKGMRPPQLESSINFNNVSFTYSSRSIKVLTGLTFKVAKGETVAIVGPSGCGKSTILNLLQRLYDPDQNTGYIEIGGIDIKCFNLGWNR